MTGLGVLLYGPPAVGKDTLTRQLETLDSRYVAFPRLKAGQGRVTGYRMTTVEQLDALDQAGRLLYRNRRYGSDYAVDRAELDRLLGGGRWPVVHLGQVAGVDALSRIPVRWVLVLLWCARETTLARCEARGDTDVAARMQAWDETLADLDTAVGRDWSVTLKTDRDDVPTDLIAGLIHAEVLAALP